MDAPAATGDEITYPKSVLGKAQLLLGAFESGAYQLRLSELSRRTGVPKASAYRLPQELVQWGLLERRGEFYQLGMRIFELGQRVPAPAVLRTAARPLLTDLFATTQATIHLAVLDRGHVLYLEQISGKANGHIHSRVGGRLPAPCTATGKMLLSKCADVGKQLHCFTRTGLPSLTPRSITCPDQLNRNLELIRERGFALEMEETRSGFASVAVSIVGFGGGPAYAAVSATLPVSQLAPRRILPRLRSTAAGIARSVDQRWSTWGLSGHRP